MESVSSEIEIESEKKIEDLEFKNYWIERFFKEFICRKGEHILVNGITGSGKTQVLYWLAEGISLMKDETMVWYDIGKSGEFLKLAKVTQRPLKVFVPEGCEIKTNSKVKFEQVETRLDPLHFGSDVWDQLDPDAVNILSIEPFILDPVEFTKTISNSFRSLIIKAHRYEIKTPLTLIYDEFHNVAPNRDNALDYAQYKAGSYIQFNVEKLRSLKIRIAASTHGMTKIRKGVKTSFNWWILRRISDNVGYEQKKLEKFTPLFHTLKNNECIIIWPNKLFSDKIRLPFYGDPMDKVYYEGIYGSW